LFSAQKQSKDKSTVVSKMPWPSQSNNDDDKKRLAENSTERSKIFLQFASLWQTKKLGMKEDIIKKADASAYKEEAKKLHAIVTNGPAQGIFGGLFIFIAMRAARGVPNRMRASSHRKKTSSYQFDSPNNAASTQKPSLLSGVFGFAYDIVTSTVCTVAITMHYGDWGENANTAAEIPLVAGRSAFSDTFCEDYVKIYTSIPKQTWEKHQGSSVEWDAISTLCQNCIRRQTMEKELRQQTSSFGFGNESPSSDFGNEPSIDFGNDSSLGFGKDSFGEEKDEDEEDRHVEIPMPGVPKDLPIDIPWVGGSDAISAGKGAQEDDFDVEHDGDSFRTEFDSFDTRSDKDEKRKRP
jgi:hypothetical protein